MNTVSGPNDDTTTAEDFRTALRLYPQQKEGKLLYLLKSFTVTLEVFLHKNLGERYLSWPRILLGLLFLWLIGHIGTPWEWRSVSFMWFPIPYPHFTHAGTAGDIFGIPIPIYVSTRFKGVSVLLVFLSVYFAVAQWRMLQIFLNNRLNVPTHNRSSGEPYALWNGCYRIFCAMNFQGDLVKQVCEPLFCLLVAGVISALTEHEEFRFLYIWLTLGALALFIKAWHENRARKKLHLDRIANEMDLAAVRMQQRFLRDEPEGSFFEVPPLR